jgi:hypothetical protein
MKLSQLILVCQAALADHGDVDILDADEYQVCGLDVHEATEGQKEYWGDDTEGVVKYAQLESNR